MLLCAAMGWFGEQQKTVGQDSDQLPLALAQRRQTHLAVFAQKTNLCPSREQALLCSGCETPLLGEEAAAQADI